ncbi:DUF2637 domain-containing protein [Actinomadura soli]|uniref:DUF2637 domain-containing protein n=1 Tax=Actinomadura soli TaxID=2508997 RepID=A0A5C4J4E0_9ACTN|nr:DUF2637 domain-containing protein [Actinomadura soli]TMQ91246.1 DUF2637 domain-containing protein [Actinomadura soli]
MPSDPTRPSFTAAQRRLLTALAGLIVAALAGAAYALSYDVLRDLARYGGVSERWAPLYPAIADTLTAMTILSLVITRNARWWTRLLRWTLLLLLLAGGAAVSVQDSVWGMSELPRDSVRAGVAVAPHIMLVLAVWLWLTMFKQIRVSRPVAEEAAPVDQRGHVKVLEPAAPEPLALEAPAEPARPQPESPFDFLDDTEPLIPFAPEEPAADQDVEDDDAGRPAPSLSPGLSLSSEPGLPSEPPPLDTLPEARPPADPVVSAPALLPTDVELVRTRDRPDAQDRPVASTTRPDIVMPAAHAPDADEDDAQPADRAEDPDADDGPAAKDVNPPPSSNFRSGPTPPVD